MAGIPTFVAGIFPKVMFDHRRRESAASVKEKYLVSKNSARKAAGFLFEPVSSLGRTCTP